MATAEGSLLIVEISEEGIQVVMAVVVAAVMVATAVVATVVEAAAVVVTSTGVKMHLGAEVKVVKDYSKAIASLSAAAMLLIDVNGMLVIGYGWDHDPGYSRQCAEGDEWYRW